MKHGTMYIAVTISPPRFCENLISPYLFFSFKIFHSSPYWVMCAIVFTLFFAIFIETNGL